MNFYKFVEPYIRSTLCPLNSMFVEQFIGNTFFCPFNCISIEQYDRYSISVVSNTRITEHTPALYSQNFNSQV